MNRNEKKISNLSPEIYDLKNSLMNAELKKMESKKNVATKKILVMGMNETGKSTLVLKFLFNLPEVSQSPEENYYSSIKYKNEDYVLHIVDHAGIDEFTPIYAGKYTFKVDGYILVYSIDNKASFDFIKRMRTQLNNANGKIIPALLVGTKLDLKEKREVNIEDVRLLSQELSIPFMEISSKRQSKETISKVFEAILKEILNAENFKDKTESLRWTAKGYKRLRLLFHFGTGFIFMLGILFVIFSTYNLLTNPERNRIGILMVLLLLDGLILSTLSVLGSCGIKREDSDCITIFTIIGYIGIILNAGCLMIQILIQTPEKTESSSLAETEPFSTILMISLILVLIFLIAIMCSSFAIKHIMKSKSLEQREESTYYESVLRTDSKILSLNRTYE